MTDAKRKSAKNDVIAFYVGRPISYIFTIPFLYMNAKPNTVSMISLAFPLLAFIVASISDNIVGNFLAWIFLFIWNILDGVDGNIARYTKKFSKIGSLWDATSGYFAMFFTYSTFGLIAYKESMNIDCIIWLFGHPCGQEMPISPVTKPVPLA